MNDLISRQAAIDAICKAGCGGGYCGISCDDVKAIEQLSSEQPEVIRCKDCKYYTPRWWCRCGEGLWKPNDDDFCSRAERRTDA